MEVFDKKSPKMLVKAKAKELGAVFTKVRTKKVGFADLTRGEAQFIQFDGLVWTYVNKWDELKAFAKENGLILASSI